MAKPTCPRCKVGGFTTDKALDGRPQFTCTACTHIWTAGQSGEPYIAPEDKEKRFKESNPFCFTPGVCKDVGYCKRERACND